MGLWLETRDDAGRLTFRGRFSGGKVVLSEGQEFTVHQAQQLAKLSNGLPLEQRDWVLRVDAD